MIVGVLKLELSFPEANSLKDKRRVLSSLKARLQERYNISVSEVDRQDAHRFGVLAVAMVATDTRSIHSQFDKLVDFVRAVPGLTLLDYERDLI